MGRKGGRGETGVPDGLDSSDTPIHTLTKLSNIVLIDYPSINGDSHSTEPKSLFLCHSEVSPQLVCPNRFDLFREKIQDDPFLVQESCSVVLTLLYDYTNGSMKVFQKHDFIGLWLFVLNVASGLIDFGGYH